MAQMLSIGLLAMAVLLLIWHFTAIKKSKNE